MDIVPTYSPSGRVSEQFPILRGTLGNTEQFDKAVEQVFEGIDAGSIRNVVLQDAKFILSRIVDRAWDEYIDVAYFDAGRWKEQPKAVQALHSSILIMGLHDVISANKKINRAEATGPAVEAMRAFCAEVLPLSLAVASLKDKVIKGRAPNTGPTKPENPNKITKTCAVCFRSIAVQRGGKMAHHGYKRPQPGWQTSSCPGIRFKPLEVSSEGLEWLIDTLRKELAGYVSSYDRQDTYPEYLLAKRERKGPAEKIYRDDPLWPAIFKRHVAQLESWIERLKREIPNLEKKLAAWKQEAPA